MENLVEIVHLSANDWREFKELRLKALKDEPQAFGKSYEEAAKDSDDAWKSRLESAGSGRSWSVFARVNGKLVGMIGAGIHSDEPDKVWIHATYVDSDYRGRDIAKKLMQTILEEIESVSPDKIVKLGVNKEQIAAVELYKQFGFKVTGEQDFIMGNGEKVREFVMEKQLQVN